MTLKIFANSSELSRFAANQILDCVQAKPNAVLCLASGETPKLTYGMVVEGAQQRHIDFTKTTIFALDEWVGIGTTNIGSCHYFLTDNLLKPLGIQADQFHFFDGLAQDPQAVCDTINTKLMAQGGLDLILVGVGLNGHVGFNEPGAPLTLHARVSDLDKITIDVGQKYFAEATTLSQGMTMGLADFFDAHTAILMASGKKKAAIMKQAIEGIISNTVPASLIRQHKNSFVLLDQDAASELTD
jgi:glucosamine-6-phosphate isomerase